MNSTPGIPLPPSSAPSTEDSAYWSRAYDEIAAGNPGAKSLLVAWAGFCHTIDDAIDQDRAPDPEAIVVRMVHWTEAVSDNEFFAANRATITALVISAANVFADSVRWERCGSEVRERYANAYRSFWVELNYHVAYLVGGYGHMRAMSQKYRDMAWGAQAAARELPLIGLEEDGPAPEELPEQPTRICPPLLPYQVRTPEDWDRLRTFAASIVRPDGSRDPHNVDARFPHVVIKTADERWVGYCAMLSVPAPGAPGVPIGCTAWHQSASRRECVEGMKLLTSWALVSYGKCATAIPVDSPLLPHMEKLGYRDWGLKLYMTD